MARCLIPLISGRLFNAQAELNKADSDILVEYDIIVPIRESFNDIKYTIQ